MWKLIKAYHIGDIGIKLLDLNSVRIWQSKSHKMDNI